MTPAPVVVVMIVVVVIIVILVTAPIAPVIVVPMPVVLVVVMVIVVTARRAAVGATAVSAPLRLRRGAPEQVAETWSRRVRVEGADESFDGVAEPGRELIDLVAVVAWAAFEPPRRASVAGGRSHASSSLLSSPERGPGTMTNARSVS